MNQLLTHESKSIDTAMQSLKKANNWLSSFIESYNPSSRLSAPTMWAISLATLGFSAMIVFIVCCFCDIRNRGIDGRRCRLL